MTDRIDRAAEVLWASIDDKGIRGRLFREDCDYLARVLADAGLLAPEGPRPMPELSPERARLLAERPAHPWTPPDGVVGIF